MEISQEIMMKANFLQKEAQELEQKQELVERQLIEFAQFKESLEVFSKNKNKEIIASLGKGVHVKATLDEQNNNELFVEVGSGIVLKKSVNDVIKVVEEQSKRIKEAQIQIKTRLDIYNSALHELVKQVEKMKSEK